MPLIEPFVKGNLLELNYPGMDALTIKLPEGGALEAMERVKVAVWGDPCLGVDLGEEVIKSIKSHLDLSMNRWVSG